MKPGTTTTKSRIVATNRACSVPDGAAASATVRLVGHDTGHGSHGEDAGAAGGAADELHERCRAADRRQDDHGKGATAQPLEQVLGVGSQDEDPDEDDDARDDG